MQKKFGTFSGVFVPSFEAILGTVLFLLLPLLTAEVGLIWMLAIIVLAHTVTFSTACSVSDCVTNLNKIGGGGLYAICKESLGKALGGAIGGSLFLAQVASVGFYVIGFTEVLYPLLAPHFELIVKEVLGINAIVYGKQIMASGFLLVFCIVVLVGANFVIKLQNLIFIILSLSILAIFISPFIGIKHESAPIFQAMPNLLGRTGMTFPFFFVVFTQFFPAVTGISAGVGMSGDLKTPQRSMVRGTFAAIAVTFVIYILVMVVFAFLDKSILLEEGAIKGKSLTALFGLGARFPYNIAASLVFVGILFATASSALSLFMSGPRTLQSIIWDKLLPKSLRFLSRDFFKRKREPRFAIVLTFLMSLVIVWAGDLSFAATLVGILFLLVYAWVNGSSFLERMSKNPTFRPTFNGHWAISLYGLLASLTVISLFNWKLGILLIASQFLVFHLLLKYKTGGALEGVWWGIWFNLMNYELNRLKEMAQSPKNWRPIMQAIALDTPEHTWQKTAKIAKQIGMFSGIVKFSLIQKEDNTNDNIDINEQDIDIQTYLYTKDPATIALNIMQYEQHILSWNTTLIEYHKELDHVSMVRKSLEMERNTILYRPAKRQSTPKEKINQATIDVWWRNENNGNFMLILSFIINKYREMTKQELLPVRILQVLQEDENEEEARALLQEHLNESRVEGRVEIIPYQKDKDFSDYLSKYSFAAPYVFTGFPGRYTDVTTETSTFFKFNLDEFFFDRMIKKFSPEVSVFFVKSKNKFNLLLE